MIRNGLAGHENIGPAQVIALCVVDAVRPQEIHRDLIFHEFRDGLLAKRMGDLIHGLHYGLIYRTGSHSLHKTSINFHIIDRKIPQMGEG